MAIALHDLRGDRLDAQAEVAAHLFFDLRVHVCELPHGARELADRDRLAGTAQPLEIPASLHVPDRRLQAERGGLGVHTVSPADDQRVLVLDREGAECAAKALLALEQKVERVPHLQRGRGVPDVVRRETDVHEARVVAELFFDAREQRDHLVLDPVLDGEDTVDVDAQRANTRHDGGGNAPAARVGLARRDLHPEPRLVLRGLAPDSSHGGPGVPLDHAVTLPENLTDW